jgi:ABC-type polysaccharide/polyol phosphate transport system ATPase subunit
MTSLDSPVISLQGISKKFSYWSERPSSMKSLLVDVLRGRLSVGQREEFYSLRDVSFDIMPGEFVGIMGRNGAGKSTLLKLICGIYTPTSGNITVRAAIAPLIELGAGFHGDLSGYENIFLNAAILGFGKKATMDALPQILGFSELGDLIHMPVKNYSSGMLVRLGFSIATHLAAPILLIDEVLAVGDAGFQKKCLMKIMALHEEGKTIILITHDPEAVSRYCDRSIGIDSHQKVFDGAPSQAADEYRRLLGVAGP